MHRKKMNEINFCNKYSLDKYIRGSSHCFNLTMHTIFDLINSKKLKFWLLIENLLQKKLNV